LIFVRAQMPVHIEVTDAGLDETRLVALADVENAVHAFQIHHDAARIRRRRSAVRQVRPVEIGYSGSLY